jgi:hypothetical protein
MIRKKTMKPVLCYQWRVVQVNARIDHCRHIRVDCDHNASCRLNFVTADCLATNGVFAPLLALPARSGRQEIHALTFATACNEGKRKHVLRVRHVHEVPVHPHLGRSSR